MGESWTGRSLPVPHDSESPHTATTGTSASTSTSNHQEKGQVRSARKWCPVAELAASGTFDWKHPAGERVTSPGASRHPSDKRYVRPPPMLGVVIHCDTYSRPPGGSTNGGSTWVGLSANAALAPSRSPTHRPKKAAPSGRTCSAVDCGSGREGASGAKRAQRRKGNGRNRTDTSAVQSGWTSTAREARACCSRKPLPNPPRRVSRPWSQSSEHCSCGMKEGDAVGRCG